METAVYWEARLLRTINLEMSKIGPDKGEADKNT